MRSDMDKIITDTYCGGKSRSKGRNPIGREANLDYENLPIKESMTRKWNLFGEGKEKSVRLAPLERYLESKIGEKWDNVYSEICKTFKKSSDLIQYAKSMVYFDVEYINNYPYQKILHKYGGQRAISERFFYVCPETGELRKGGKRERTIKVKFEDIIKVRYNNHIFVEKINSIWYRINFEKVDHSINNGYGDVYLKEHKRQLNTKEIKIVEDWIKESVDYLNKFQKNNIWKFVDFMGSKGASLKSDWDGLKPIFLK